MGESTLRAHENDQKDQTSWKSWLVAVQASWSGPDSPTRISHTFWIVVLTVVWKKTISYAFDVFMQMLASLCWYEPGEILSPCWIQLWYNPNLKVVQPARQNAAPFGNPQKLSNSSNL